VRIPSKTREWGEIEWGVTVLPDEERGKKRGWVLLVGHFYITLNVEVEREYVII
jgi:hypothetical protein